MALVLLPLLCGLFLNGCSGTGAASSSNSGTGPLTALNDSVTFGNVPVGQTASTTVTLVNQSGVPVQIAQMSVTGQAFSTISPTSVPVTINAQSTLNISVGFNPSTMGAATGQLLITTDPTDGATMQIGLAGTGTQAGTTTLSSLSCTSSAVTGSAPDACTVALTGAAPSGGLVVNLTSNNAAVTVPATVTVAAGAVSANFTATISTVGSAQMATLTASAAGTSETFVLNLGALVPSVGPALSLSFASLAFGNTNVNTPTTQSVILSSTGTAAVTVSAGTVTGTGFTISGVSFPLTLNANQTAALTVQFDPTTSGAATGLLTLTSNSSTGNSSAINLSGTGVPVLSGLSCTNGSMTGAGTDSCTVTLNAAAASGGMAVSLASNNSTVKVPSTATVAAGATSANFTATVSTVSSPAAVTLTASAAGVSKTFALQLGSTVPTLSISASSIGFGSVGLNSPATQSITLASTGTASVTVSGAVAKGAGFTVSGASFPLTLTPNQAATLNVVFDPTAAGAATGTLTVTSNSSTNASAVIGLTGTGVAASYQVNLSWQAPSSSADPVAGYNVYRSPSGGTSYQVLNSSPVTQTTYVDATVQPGQTYDYIVESVDGSGIVSSPSNMAAATTP